MTKPHISAPQASSFRFRWPNTADFNFNYCELLQRTSRKGIGKAPEQKVPLRIAIGGAGVAGLTVARELFRAGYEHIDIFEASDRIGGRCWSVRAPKSKEVEQDTVYEFGAMRIPLFGDGVPNSVFHYYMQLFNLETQAFPNPQSKNDEGEAIKTAVSYRGALLRPWLDAAGVTDSETDEDPKKQAQRAEFLTSIKIIERKWESFKNRFQITAARYYHDDDQWRLFWRAVAAQYWDKDFRDLVREAAHNNPKRHELGEFGGLGMTADEAKMFAVIGAGDGGWGAFYDISALYVIRTLLCGYGPPHRLIIGKPDHQIDPDYKPENEEEARKLHFLGVESLAHCLLYERGESSLPPKSVVKVHYNTTIKSCRFTGKEVYVTTQREGEEPQLEELPYDVVVLTPSTWAIQEIGSEGTLDDLLKDGPIPFSAVRSTLDNSHWISSCKVFYPLTKRYWEENPEIPQVIVTDTPLRDVYAYAVGEDAERNPGVLLLSYTWEDDADKHLVETLDKEKWRDFGEDCLKKLEQVVGKEKYKKIKEAILLEEEGELKGELVEPEIIHWRTQKQYRGCSKLYRSSSWDDDYRLLAFNQECSKTTRLYFAGEACSVEGGWLEPALRTALDAVIHVIKNTGGSFYGGFKFEDYPRYDWSWSPDPSQPFAGDGAD